MESIFLISLIVLGALAILDLVVGVSNDAVNFLNSAIGSKAAPRRVIMIVASLGIIIGASFSSGMMEVARSGVFYPNMFSFSDIMMLFLAVMFADVILLDIFNTFGMPTSTTVSLVFGLLGSSVGVASSKIWSDPMANPNLVDYINSGKALGIISGILLSVVVAFVCGAIVMYITRFIFTFSYRQKFRRFGAIWCGIAITAISHFALIKGLKGSSVMPVEVLNYINESGTLITVGLFVFWTIIMYICQHIFNFKILRITVLAGTFALALAFAGNDLVNFIGIFIAGYDSFNIASLSGDPSMLMGDLAKPIEAQLWILLLAGFIMVITLWFSKKAWSVTETELNLSKKDVGVERFGSSPISRALVRGAVSVNKRFSSIIPERASRFIENRFAEPDEHYFEDDSAAFDLLRATVNLTTAALLISMATSFKLPLSTTYVTFMVAMGTSLTDRAWGRETAVYRITGVLTVISGWFLTALIAFSISFIIAIVLMYGGTVAIVGMIILAVVLLYNSNKAHSRKSKKVKVDAENMNLSVVDRCTKDLSLTIEKANSIYCRTLTGLYTEDRKLLKQVARESEEMYNDAHERKYEVNSVLLSMDEGHIKTGHYYVQVVDYVNEIAKALLHITRPSFLHIDNHHSGFTKEQMEDLKKVNDSVNEINSLIIEILNSGDYSNLRMTMVLRERLFDDIAQITENQIRRIKNGGTSTRGSMLYLEILNETKTMVLQLRNLLKSQHYFVSK